MDLEAVFSNSMSSKKTPKGMFHGPADSSFSQRKKASLGNVKHSGDEKNISLKSGSDASVYSNVESLSDNDENVSISGGFDGSLLDSAVNTPKTKRVNTGANFGSPIGSPDFEMDEEVKPLPPLLRKKIPLDKIWIDPKIIKIPVEMSVKKSFALDINLLAVEEKSAMQKTQFVRKNFSKINGFGGATTPLKFEGIIRSTFTSEESMKKAILLPGENGISVNNNLRKQEFHSDWAVVIKKIPIDMPKDIIITAVSEFGQIKLIKIQLIGMALLFTLPVEMTAHNLGTLLEKAGGKTCIINHSLETGNRFCCAVVGFESNEKLESAFRTEPIFGEVRLSWAKLDLVWYEKCGHFGHSILECDVLVESSSGLPNLFKKSASGFDCLQLARLYVKKNVPISHPAAFVMSLASPSGGFSSGSGLLSGGKSLSFGSSGPQVDGLGDCLAVLEHSLEILSDQISVILKKLSFVNLVPLASTSRAFFMAGTVPSALVVDLDMALDDMLALFVLPFSSSNEPTAGLNLSGSKMLTSKFDSGEIGSLVFWFRLILTPFIPMSDLIWKLATCNIRDINVPAKQTDIVYCHVSSGNMVFFVAETKLKSSSGSWIRDKFDGIQIFTSELDIGYLGAGVVVIINNSLAHYVSRIEEIPGHLISIWLLFKGKLSVTILGLYAGASPGTRFAQAPVVNFLIVKTVNSSTFVFLGGNFNENSSGKSASFKFYLGLGLINSFAGHFLKTIDFILVSGTLSSTVAKHCVNSVSDFFDMDHKSVIILVGLGGLLDVRLNGLHKQTNKDCWKFKIKDADGARWFHFKECSSAKMLEVKGRFLGAAAGLDLDAMWTLLKKVVVDSADEIFSKHWFCDFQCSKNKHSSKFLGLELLVVKIVKCLTSADTSDASKALILEDMVRGGQKVEDLLSYLLLIRKGYRKSKMFESKLLQEATIKKAIKRHMEQFCSDKGSMIRSVLDWSFRKVVLDHLVVNDELILEPEEVRSGVDKIMEGWTQKHVMPMVLLNLWAYQYVPLNYVRDDAFSNVMNVISIGELLSVTNGLPDNKAAGLFGIPNKL
ncbi:hypothetical protein G9A89_008295 [Geosiphon pyriformis]|nr:hypothetical protein G9A89_008295 [Geosiphon pyriformis]